MEKKYESDLLFKEKVKLECQKIKNLSGKKRVEYLWTYYRFLILVAIAVFLVISTGVTMFKNQQKAQLLSIAIIDANNDKSTEINKLKEDLLVYLGSKNSHDEVVLDTSASSLNTDENVAKVVMVMSVVSHTDVVVCNQEVYDRFCNESIYLSWKDLLGDDYEKYEPYMTNGIIDLSRIEKWNLGVYTSYSPAYLCVLKKSKHAGQAKDFINYFLE